MLSHANLLATMRMYAQQLDLGPTHSIYQFLPLAHVLARVAQAVALSVGARVIYWGGDPANIADELAVAAPTHLPAVPRIYEKIHGAVTGKVAEGRLHERLLFRWALGCGARARSTPRLLAPASHSTVCSAATTRARRRSARASVSRCGWSSRRSPTC